MSWYDIDSDVAVAATELAGNWKRFESFGWDRDARPVDADSCAIVYLSHRDADVLTESNAAQVKEALAEFTGWMSDPTDGFAHDVEEQSHRHWAVGHVDGIVIRCLTVDGQPTEAFKVFHELCMRLADYPVLDEDDFSQRERDAADEAWDNYGASDFRSCLAKLAPHHDELFCTIPTDHLRTIWEALAEKHLGGESVIHERSPYFPFSSLFGETAVWWRRQEVTWPAIRTIILDIKADQHSMRLARKIDARIRAEKETES